MFRNEVMIIVFTTVPTPEAAELMAESLVRARLAACVQILPQMTSVYAWEGAVQREPEHLLLIKTLEEKYDALEMAIRAEHSYEVPEIVAIPASNVSADYLSWMGQCLS
jgi:periplasmic divalent cation tolerance protein